MSLTWEVAVEDSGLSRERLFENAGLLVTQHIWSSRRPVEVRAKAEEHHFSLILNLAGAYLIRPQTSPPKLLPPSSAVLLRGPAEISWICTRGEHRSVELNWPMALTAGLTEWVNIHRPREGQTAAVRFATSVQFRALYARSTERILDATRRKSDLAFPVILAQLHELVARTVLGSADFAMVTIPHEVPDPLKQLMEAVVQSPAASWSLKEAATFAGYSPFHLSRIFRSALGYGFPEFVDRCRSEIAVKQILGSNSSLDEISNQCGFGSPQALRESLREYLGVLPSELRITSQEAYEFLPGRK